MSHHRTAPIVCVSTWETVMQGAGWRCQCTGACGSKHTKTALRCDRDADRARLLAAPADLSLSPTDAARVPVAELLAWCPDCHRKATGRHQRDARERARLEAPAPAGLFSDEELFTA